MRTNVSSIYHIIFLMDLYWSVEHKFATTDVERILKLYASKSIVTACIKEESIDQNLLQQI